MLAHLNSQKFKYSIEVASPQPDFDARQLTSVLSYFAGHKNLFAAEYLQRKKNGMTTLGDRWNSYQPAYIAWDKKEGFLRVNIKRMDDGKVFVEGYDWSGNNRTTSALSPESYEGAMRYFRVFRDLLTKNGIDVELKILVETKPG